MVAIPTARDALSKYSVTLQPDADVLEAIDVLVRKRVAGAPVVSAEGELVGFLTEKDCLRILSNTSWDAIAGGKVRDFMSITRTVIRSDMDIFATAEAFLETNFPVLPLLENDKLLGRITRQDVLRRVQATNRALHRERDKREKRLQKQEPDGAALQELQSSHTPGELAELLTKARR